MIYIYDACINAFWFAFFFPIYLYHCQFYNQFSMIYIMNNDCLAYKDNKQYVIIIVTIKMFQEQTLHATNIYSNAIADYYIDKVEDWRYMYYASKRCNATHNLRILRIERKVISILKLILYNIFYPFRHSRNILKVFRGQHNNILAIRTSFGDLCCMAHV